MKSFGERNSTVRHVFARYVSEPEKSAGVSLKASGLRAAKELPQCVFYRIYGMFSLDTVVISILVSTTL